MFSIAPAQPVLTAIRALERERMGKRWGGDWEGKGGEGDGLLWERRQAGGRSKTFDRSMRRAWLLGPGGQPSTVRRACVCVCGLCQQRVRLVQ